MKAHKMLKPNKCTKFKPKPKPWDNTCLIYVCPSLRTTVVNNTAQNSSDNLPTCPMDSCHCSDIVYWRGGGRIMKHTQTSCSTASDTGLEQNFCTMLGYPS